MKLYAEDQNPSTVTLSIKNKINILLINLIKYKAMQMMKFRVMPKLAKKSFRAY